jgi:hypothetical protein
MEDVMRLAFLAVLGLAGCAANVPGDAGPAELAGRNVRDAIALMGAPATQSESGGDTVYTWLRTTESATYLPNQTVNSGFIGSPSPGALEGPSGAYVAQQHTCRIRMTATRDGKVRSVDFKGPRGACDGIGSQLSAAMKTPA